ncbi:uncharacterized protein LOC144147397 [Haemaphysalis longicornis]
MESYDFDSCTSGGRNAYGAYPIQQPRRLRGPPEESEGREGEVEEEEEQDEDADEHLEADEDEETDGDEGKEEQMEAVNKSGVAGSKKRIGLKARGMPSDDDGAPDLFTRQL